MPDQHPAAALPQEIDAWDALACARLDGVADALYLGLRRPSVDGAEKWAGRAPDVQVRGASRRLGLRAAPVEVRRESALCIRVWDPFEERSSVAQVAVKERAGTPGWKRLRARRRRPWDPQMA